MTTPTGSRQGRRKTPLLSSTLVGATILLAGITATFLSYNANKGLPFVDTYDITVEVPDAARLVKASSEVRIGGARVGTVQDVQAVRPAGNQPPYAKIKVALDPTEANLPADTHAAVRPRSLLGAKYLDLSPGRSKKKIPAGGTLPLRNATPIVEVSDTFQIFSGAARRGLQGTIISLGDALAGRGTDLNTFIVELSEVLPPAQRVLRTLVDQSTDLDGFITGAAQAGEAFAPVARQLGQALDDAGTTMRALDASGSALPDTVAELSPTERTGTAAMTKLRPVLDDAAALARGLRPAAEELPRATNRIAGGLHDITPTLRRVPALRRPLQDTLASIARLASSPDAQPAVKQLTETVKIVISLGSVLIPAQLECNTLGEFVRNTGSITSVGDENGNWITFLFMLGSNDQALQAAKPAPTLHWNPYPKLGNGECEAGNEPFGPGQLLGNPPGVQTGVAETAPPPEATDRARAAGLLEGPGR